MEENKLIPASSAKHAQAVADAAKTLSYETAQGMVSDFIVADKKLMVKDMADNAAVYTKLLTQLRKNIADFPADAKKATLADYGHFWGQYIRAPGTALPVLVAQYPQLESERKIWKQFSNKQTTPADDESAGKPGGRAHQGGTASQAETRKTLRPTSYGGRSPTG